MSYKEKAKEFCEKHNIEPKQLGYLVVLHERFKNQESERISVEANRLKSELELCKVLHSLEGSKIFKQLTTIDGDPTNAVVSQFASIAMGVKKNKEIKQLKEDVQYLLKFVPEWATKTEEGLNPTFYGTGSYKGDLKVIDRINKIKPKP